MKKSNNIIRKVSYRRLRQLRRERVIYNVGAVMKSDNLSIDNEKTDMHGMIIYKIKKYPVLKTNTDIKYPFGMKKMLRKKVISQDQVDRLMSMLNSGQIELENLAISIVTKLEEKYAKNKKKRKSSRFWICRSKIFQE